MKADHLSADCPDCGQSFRVKPPVGHRFLNPDEAAEDAALDRIAEASVTRFFRRLLKERRRLPERREVDSDAAVKAFLEAWDREAR